MATVNDYQPCNECGELEAHELHHDFSDVLVQHVDACNVDASWEGEETGYVMTMDCHEWEPGCYCADSGRCEVCVEKAVSAAEATR